MLAKQFISTSLRAIKSSAPAVSRQSSRVSVLNRSFQSVRSLAGPTSSLRSLSSTPLRSDEDPSHSQQDQPVSTNPQAQALATADLPAVYLSNLSFAVTEEALTDFLKQCTPVKKVDVVRNSDGAVRGFGFAKYATLAEAEAAVTAINGLDFLGRQIVAAISQRRPMISDASNQLFMSGFPTQGEADEASLRLALHERLGVQPRAIRLHKFPGGFLKGTGHLEFEDVATLESVLAKLQDTAADQPILVNGHPITLVKARPLLQPRSRSGPGSDNGAGRGGFGAMRGRPGYGAGYAGAGYGGYPAAPADGYSGQMGGYPNQGYGNAYYPPPPTGPPGSGGYGGGYGSQGEGGQGGGNPQY
ncbi:Protein phosphatase PP2A regulatory subunit B [Puccinia graminis f. sp. tritici]|uniref:Protein phosphatase PP2A regulatory subunit B n=1 Tax=Puccinia graminis f. sp. tritici TaxID=56615 RepID=A0A5B0SHT1_PUCGR|nr:Protein phosphatase PP2A regulatory subunit B [Puccinia graminis f. sp. tritici]